MTSTQTIPYEEHATQFLNGLKSHLISFTALQLIAVVRIIFSKIRNCFTAEQTVQLFTITPGFFQFVFMEHWSDQDKNTHCLHLDELVSELIKDDQREGRGLFKSEVKTLSIVLIVLKHLENFLKQFGISPYPYTLAHELQQALQGETI